MDVDSHVGKGETLVREWASFHPDIPLTKTYAELARRIDTAANDAATQMRDACVKKVREIATAWHTDDRTAEVKATWVESTLLDTATALSSLTLDQVKREKESK